MRARLTVSGGYLSQHTRATTVVVIANKIPNSVVQIASDFDDCVFERLRQLISSLANDEPDHIVVIVKGK